MMKKAFTILELVFVVVILGILLAFALPKFSSSKNEAELSRSLNNLKTLINDISIYALKNDTLTSMSMMSNVDEVENVDLRHLNGVKEVGFGVGDDRQCLKLVFIDRADFVLMGISSNEESKNAIINKAGGTRENFDDIDFTSTSSSRICVALSKSENFKNLARKTYLLIGELNDSK